LTDQYNLKRKKKYQKVIFRLPSESEWKLGVAADSASGFPWTNSWPAPVIKQGIPFLKSPNRRNCVNNLIWANVAFPGRIYFDGVIYTGKTGELKPNVFGLYDVIGNVSEMMNNGTLKGGDWATYLYKCSVNHAKDYTYPDTRVGFRVFMEMIQE
jgi:formylglycine-generating enzyme required for sulfatase activity